MLSVLIHLCQYHEKSCNREKRVGRGGNKIHHILFKITIYLPVLLLEAIVIFIIPLRCSSRRQPALMLNMVSSDYCNAWMEGHQQHQGYKLGWEANRHSGRRQGQTTSISCQKTLYASHQESNLTWRQPYSSFIYQYIIFFYVSMSNSPSLTWSIMTCKKMFRSSPR